MTEFEPLKFFSKNPKTNDDVIFPVSTWTLLARNQSRDQGRSWKNFAVLDKSV